VDGKNYIGIYLSQTSATVVALNCHGRDHKITDCFSVSVEQQAETEDTVKMAEELAELVLKKSAQRALSFQDKEIFIALDCSMFMQHNIRSELTDPQQIANTIRSNTEEVFANDISDHALAYKITAKDSTGSNVIVYTAKRKIINDFISAFQKHNIDPVTIEPDIVCLSKFISTGFRSQKEALNIFAFLSVNNGYLIVPASSPNKPPVARTFFISPNQNRTNLLKNQLTLTLALLNQNTSGAIFKILDSTDSASPQQLSQILPTETIDLDAYFEKTPLAECKDKVDFAIACGAALAFSDKAQTIDFRKDFSPFQGKRIKLQKTLKIVSICAVICLFAFGIFFQGKLISVSNQRKDQLELFESYFLDCLPGSKNMPMPFSEAVRKLEREKNRLLSYHQGRFDETGQQSSVPAKFTLLLRAFNQCASQTGIAVDSISITGKSLTLSASTTSKQNTLKLRDAVLKNNLIIKQENDLGFKDGRNLFKLTLETK
jgi:hypothetical protein